ncbi:hypothetical protein B0H16DRAFT_1734337 [Mycena metata]|uniref:Uncharacterized protein n=1 Tax=Mycena metata TaxID=1033252 RepID=A0AAD7HVC6_9AGAR|nr:hypothetical protein B0H16DRAFT_1734337 [Mycena metata]
MDVPFALVMDGDPLTEVSSGVEDVSLSEPTLESTEPSNLLEASMSRTSKIITSIHLVLIVFLLLCQAYETVGWSCD